MREAPIVSGVVDSADLASGRIVIACKDGTYAFVKLRAWHRVSVGAEVFWSHTVAYDGVLVSGGGYRLEFDLAVWGLTEEAARSRFVDAPS
jgi:hypothetical protein